MILPSRYWTIWFLWRSLPHSLTVEEMLFLLQ